MAPLLVSLPTLHCIWGSSTYGKLHGNVGVLDSRQGWSLAVYVHEPPEPAAGPLFLCQHFISY